MVTRGGEREIGAVNGRLTDNREELAWLTYAYSENLLSFLVDLINQCCWVHDRMILFNPWNIMIVDYYADLGSNFIVFFHLTYATDIKIYLHLFGTPWHQRWCYTEWFATTIFSLTKRCNIGTML